MALSRSVTTTIVACPEPFRGNCLLHRTLAVLTLLGATYPLDLQERTALLPIEPGPPHPLLALTSCPFPLDGQVGHLRHRLACDGTGQQLANLSVLGPDRWISHPDVTDGKPQTWNIQPGTGATHNFFRVPQLPPRDCAIPVAQIMWCAGIWWCDEDKFRKAVANTVDPEYFTWAPREDDPRLTKTKFFRPSAEQIAALGVAVAPGPPAGRKRSPATKSAAAAVWKPKLHTAGPAPAPQAADPQSSAPTAPAADPIGPPRSSDPGAGAAAEQGDAPGAPGSPPPGASLPLGQFLSLPSSNAPTQTLFPSMALEITLLSKVNGRRPPKGHGKAEVFIKVMDTVILRPYPQLYNGEVHITWFPYGQSFMQAHLDMHRDALALVLRVTPHYRTRTVRGAPSGPAL